MLNYSDRMDPRKNSGMLNYSDRMDPRKSVYRT